MSGHSKWSQIKRQKGVTDAKRGQVFTRLAREISVAARSGGGPDPNANFRLRLAIQRARESNMPMENVDRAIKRGAGGADGAVLEEVTYEGYGPGGAAILVEAMTDNRNRTASDIRNAFAKGGGNLGESGSVAWIFEAKGVITIEPGKRDPEEIALLAIDGGAEDVKPDVDAFEVYTEPSDMEKVRKSLEDQRVSITSAEVLMQPKTSVFLKEKEAVQALKLVDRLEELDDVQKVYFNADFESDVLEQV